MLARMLVCVLAAVLQINKPPSSADTPFWLRADFLIATSIGLAGLYFSFRAFVEAKRAKQAAIVAGRTVKLQTVTIELTEVTQKLARLEPKIRFNVARELLADASHRVRRAVSPFANDPALRASIAAVLDALAAARQSLKDVQPQDTSKEDETPDAVYYGIEAQFASLNDSIANLTGLFEAKTIDFGEDHGQT